GFVLVCVLGSTWLTAYNTQRDLIDESLERALNDDLDHLPELGSMRAHGGGDQDRGGHLLALAVDVSEDGVVIRTGRSPLSINSSVLTEVVNEALDSPDESGTIPDLHVAWRRAYHFEDSGQEDYYDEYDPYYGAYQDENFVRIAIVDTTAADSALAEQVKSDAIIVVLGLAALFAVSWLLSSWALKPVEKAWEDQRRFIADASHELKTPLAVIIANTDILKADGSIGPEAMRWVTSTADEAAQMRSLVNDLLELARTDEGSSSGIMRREDVDLSDVVDSAALEFDAIAFERMCLIETNVEPDVHVQGDPEWLERLAKILIDNACKYAAEGSTITVTLTRAQGNTCFTVNNVGNVIDPEDLAHLFDRFYRSDKARNRETGGFGLGLAIAKGIAETHGGKISATSTEESGTTFTVTL
ncbi:MAG: hypothetical protein IJ781_12900, partial [Atopobiaceae bacterium]|nr:hypothetical protein [Atopobiaceae bacterium]